VRAAPASFSRLPCLENRCFGYSVGREARLGHRLRANFRSAVNEIYPTTASGAPAKGPFPVLLTMTPYGKGQGGSSSPGSAASPGGESATGGADDYLVERGYIEVVEDVRGTGDSNGSWGLFDPVQQRDAIKVLGWAARLPRSDGRVGTYGPRIWASTSCCSPVRSAHAHR
jgi:uncharacterized protein